MNDAQGPRLLSGDGRVTPPSRGLRPVEDGGNFERREEEGEDECDCQH